MSNKTAKTGLDFVSILEGTKTPTSLKIVRKAIGISSKIFPEFTARQTLKIFLTPKREKGLNQLGTALPGRVQYEDILGEQIFTYEEGEGPKILVVHGWGSSTYRIRPVIRSLVANGFKVISFDAKGSGLSSGKMTNVMEYIEIVKYLSEKHGGFDAAVTHSFGGLAALLGTLEGIEFKRIITISPPLRAAVIFSSFYKMLGVPQNVQTRMQRRFEEKIGRTIEEISPIEINLQLPPTKIIHDRDDEVLPVEDVREFVSRYEGVEFYETKGLGHRRILKDEVVLKEIVDFLTPIRKDTHAPTIS